MRVITHASPYLMRAETSIDTDKTSFLFHYHAFTLTRAGSCLRNKTLTKNYYIDMLFLYHNLNHKVVLSF